MLLPRTSSVSQSLCGLDNKLLQTNVTAVLFFSPLKFGFLSVPAFYFTTQIKNYFLVKNPNSTPSSSCYLARKTGGQRRRGMDDPTVQAPRGTKAPSSSLWLHCFPPLHTPHAQPYLPSLSIAVSLSRGVEIIPLDVLLGNNVHFRSTAQSSQRLTLPGNLIPTVLSASIRESFTSSCCRK